MISLQKLQERHDAGLNAKNHRWPEGLTGKHLVAAKKAEWMAQKRMLDAHQVKRDKASAADAERALRRERRLERNKKIIEASRMKKMTFDQLAAAHKISRTRVVQILKEAKGRR